MGSNECTLKDNSIHLIDFGFATRYVNHKTGLHKELLGTENFSGNLLFSSLNQLQFKS